MAHLVTANGLRVAFQQWGDAGPLALLVHGFPDTPATWRHLAPRLASAGFRVVAPWTRGYAPTDIPEDGDYSIEARAADLNRLHEVLGATHDAVLVGHDWGANAAYAAAAAAPQRWRRVVTMAVPPEPVLHGMGRRPRDLARAWYMGAAQFPIEGLLSRRGVRPLLALWRLWSPGYQPTLEDREALRASLAHRDNLHAALSYYRAPLADALRRRYPRNHGPIPPQPTLYLHGADDGCLRAQHVDAARGVLRGGNARSRAEVVPGVGHFMHFEQPDVVGDLILQWVTGA